MDYTVVLGVDASTIKSLELVLPSWLEHKPSLFEKKFVVFYDQVDCFDLQSMFPDHINLGLHPWPPDGVQYIRSNDSKWTNSQRAKMLAGFCHLPDWIRTQYWLKLDLDVVAQPGHDDWIQDDWFYDYPAIVAPKWGYTKPADAMLKMDLFVEANKKDIGMLQGTNPLNLIPEQGSSMVSHPRICSWCAFFQTQFTRDCGNIASQLCGPGQIPIDSQDGFHWYMAKRAGRPIRTVNMKQHGWKLCANFNEVRKHVGGFR